MQPRHGFQQNFLPFTIELTRKYAEPRGVAVRVGERAHETSADHVGGVSQDGNGFSRLLRGTHGLVARANNDVNRSFNQFRGMFRKLFDAQP